MRHSMSLLIVGRSHNPVYVNPFLFDRRLIGYQTRLVPRFANSSIHARLVQLREIVPSLKRNPPRGNTSFERIHSELVLHLRSKASFPSRCLCFFSCIPIFPSIFIRRYVLETTLSSWRMFADGLWWMISGMDSAAKPSRLYTIVIWSIHFASIWDNAIDSRRS